jgi:N4-gp56 family major capsid protein
MNTYGDIGEVTAGRMSAEFLKRGMPYLCLEKFGQSKPLPANKTKTLPFRRYNSLALATTPLTEGVTPKGKKITVTDIDLVLNQYGDLVEITDVVTDTHTDPVIQQMTPVLAEQAAKTVETIRYGVLKACTNKFYANGTTRAGLTTGITIGKQRKVVRALKRQNASTVTTAIKSTANFNTESVSPAFICVCHTDCETDVRAMTGFIDVKDYGSVTPYENEIGSVEGVRYLISNIFEPYLAAGGAVGTNISAGGVAADVYPYIFIGRDAYAISALKGQYAITPSVINPSPTKSDPLGQRGSIAWKTMQGAVILNDLWMAVLEATVTELT